MSLLHGWLYLINDSSGEHHLGYFIEHTGLFFHNVAYTKYGIDLFMDWFSNSYGYTVSLDTIT
jgi:hypothetical protein